jgi:hypothetical protein
MVAVRFINTLYWQPAIPHLFLYALINSAVRLTVFLLLVCLIVDVAEKQRMLQQNIRILRGLLPICSHCKKIRTSDGDWQQLETYISHHSEATFSHSICPACRKEHYGSVTAQPRRQHSS